LDVATAGSSGCGFGSSSYISSFFSSSVGLRLDLELSFLMPLLRGIFVLVSVDSLRICSLFYFLTGDIDVDVSCAGIVTS
jgi:hypothetical protein